MRSIWKMLRVGGRVIHCCPAANYVDHGFYCVSPTFFWDFYTTNHFEMNSIHVVCHTDDHIHGRRDVCVYTPGCLESVSFGGLDDRMYVTHCVATKTEASTGDRIPQQSRYAAEYEEARAKAAAASTSGLAAGSQDTGQGLASTVAAQCKSMGRTLVRAAKSTARRRVPPVYYLSRASYLWMRGQFRTNCDRVSRLRRRFWRKKKGLALEVVARL
jgi:hypothetical protein